MWTFSAPSLAFQEDMIAFITTVFRLLENSTRHCSLVSTKFKLGRYVLQSLQLIIEGETEAEEQFTSLSVPWLCFMCCPEGFASTYW